MTSDVSLLLLGALIPEYGPVDGVWGDPHRLGRAACEAHPRLFEHPHRDPFRGKAAQAELGVYLGQAHNARAKPLRMHPFFSGWHGLSLDRGIQGPGFPKRCLWVEGESSSRR